MDQYPNRVNDRNAILDKEKRKEYKKQYIIYQKTWGGRTDIPNNSLLKIDPYLFIY